MENSKKRKCARVVAVLDVVFTVVLIFYLIPVMIEASNSSGDVLQQVQKPQGNGTEENGGHKDLKKGQIRLIITSWVGVVVYYILAFIQVWADIQLWATTDRVSDPMEALQVARFWRNLTILNFMYSLFLVVLLNWIIVNFELMIYPIATLPLRLVCLWLGERFIQELKLYSSSVRAPAA